jgi:hypothetical protein
MAAGRGPSFFVSALHSRGRYVGHAGVGSAHVSVHDAMTRRASRPRRYDSER